MTNEKDEKEKSIPMGPQGYWFSGKDFQRNALEMMEFLEQTGYFSRSKPQLGLADEFTNMLYPGVEYTPDGTPVPRIDPLLNYEQQMRVGTMSDFGSFLDKIFLLPAYLRKGWNVGKNKKIDMPKTKALPLRELDEMYMGMYGVPYLDWINANIITNPAAPAVVEQEEYGATENLLRRTVSTTTPATSTSSKLPFSDYSEALGYVSSLASAVNAVNHAEI